MKAIDELFAAAHWDQTRREEIANSVSHGFGLAAAIVATPFLCMAAARQPNQAFYVGTIIFVATMWLLYLVSTLYHAWPQTRLKCVLQIVDHSAIFLLIAGTYTPFTLGALRGPIGFAYFVVIWGLAAAGIAVKSKFELHPGVSAGVYVAMGWGILLAARPLVAAVGSAGITLILAGGAFYTLGVTFYLWRRLRWSHVVWHLFVLGGSVCHFLAVLWYAAGPAVRT